MRALIWLARAVSIHAPTGGATGSRAGGGRSRGFNSRAHGGRDGADEVHRQSSREFQFTRPRGARLIEEAIERKISVSIHAPTGGATEASNATAIASEFQFTRPRGARRSNPPRRGRSVGFNSRAHGGRDPRPHETPQSRRVSIHAPTGGATRSAKRGAWPDVFQFTRPRGARQAVFAEKRREKCFNSRAHGGRDLRARVRVRLGERVSIHAPTGGATCVRLAFARGEGFQFTRPRGARPNAAWEDAAGKMFQFTRPRGARLALYLSPDQMSGVSIHAPTGGAT